MFKSSDEYSSYRRHGTQPKQKPVRRTRFCSFKNFLRICREYNIKNLHNYNIVVLVDKRLPPNPQEYYNPSFLIEDMWEILMGRRYTFKQFLKATEYGKWSCVTGKPKRVFFTFEQFVQECITRKIFSGELYKLHREEEARFPGKPEDCYKGKVFQSMSYWKGIQKLYQEAQEKDKEESINEH